MFLPLTEGPAQTHNNQKQNTYAKKSQDDFFDLILICETQNIQIPIERHQGNHQS